MAIRRERSAASMFSEPDGATPFRSFTRNFTAPSEAGESMITFQFASNTSPPYDVTGHAPRLVELLRVREHVIPAPGGRGEVLPVHEHLDVADDRDAEEVPRLALLAGRHGAARRRPGPDLVDHVGDIGVRLEAVRRVEGGEPLLGPELGHPGVVEHDE